MTNLSVRFPAPFPATVAGTGGIAVEKQNGVWIIAPDFSTLAEILPAVLSDPSARQVWIYDPVGDTYNVLTLAGLGDALYKATSTTSLAIGTGSKTFITQSGKDFAIGSFMLATSDADPTNYMLGQITAYSGTSLTISVAGSGVGGSGTYADWTLRASSPTGAQGATGPGYAATSTTSLTVGAGSKAFTTQAVLAYSVGARVRASSAANGANYMEGLVAGYSATTLTVNVSKVGGAGTFADWNINLAGDPGSGDLTSTANLSDIASPKTGFDNISVHGADVASASTIDLDAAGGVLINVTGTMAITAITLADGRERVVRFTGALTLTNGASLVLPGGQNIVTAAGDFAVFRGYAAGVVRCVDYIRKDGHPLTALLATIASAATTDLGSNIAECIAISGTTTITSFGSTAPTGVVKFLQFQGALTLTHNGTSLIIPGSANILTAAGDMAVVRHEGSGTGACWRSRKRRAGRSIPASPTRSRKALARHHSPPAPSRAAPTRPRRRMEIFST